LNTRNQRLLIWGKKGWKCRVVLLGIKEQQASEGRKVQKGTHGTHYREFWRGKKWDKSIRIGGGTPVLSLLTVTHTTPYGKHVSGKQSNGETYTFLVGRPKKKKNLAITAKSYAVYTVPGRKKKKKG